MANEKAGYIILDNVLILVIKMRPKIDKSLCNQESSVDSLFFIPVRIFISSLVLQSFVIIIPKYFTSFLTGI